MSSLITAEQLLAARMVVELIASVAPPDMQAQTRAVLGWIADEATWETYPEVASLTIQVMQHVLDAHQKDTVLVSAFSTKEDGDERAADTIKTMVGICCLGRLAVDIGKAGKEA